MRKTSRQLIILVLASITSFSSLGQEYQKRAEIDSIYALLDDASTVDSLALLQRLCQILPYDSASYGKQISQQLQKTSRQLKELRYETHFIFYEALFDERLSNLDKAMESYDLAYRRSMKDEDHLFGINSLLGVAVIHQKKGSYDLALSTLDTLRTVAQQYKEESKEIFLLYLRVLDLTGDTHYSKGDYENAISWYQQITELEETNEEQHSEILANAYKGISAVYSTIGRLAESIDFGHKALSLFEGLGNSSQVGQTLNELGRAYVKLEEYDKGLEFYDRSLKIKEALGDKQGMAVTLQNIGIVHSRQKNYGLALENYDKSREIKQSLGIERGMAALSINIGLIHKRLGEYSKAEEYYLDGVRRAEQTGSTTYRGIALSNLSSLYLSWAKFDLARAYGLRAVEAAKARKSKSALSNAYYNLHEAYVGLDDYKKAYEFFALAVQYNDSLVEERNASAIARIEQEYAKESQERALELKNKDLELVAAQERLSNNSKLIIILTSLGILSIAAYIIRLLIVKSKRQRKEAESEKSLLEIRAKLTTKELEIERLSREKDQRQLEKLSGEITRKNSELGRMEKDLDRLTQDLVSQQVKEKNGLAETVFTHSTNGEQWSRFMDYFHDVYHDYLERLKIKFPGITPNELRLCALIKINLSTKEIASALHITPESLRTAKYRLRKKMELDSDNKLDDFLLQF